jgi:hypothetical protein
MHTSNEKTFKLFKSFKASKRFICFRVLSPISVHPETTQCHSFALLKDRSERSEESPVAVETTRFFVTPFLRMTLQIGLSG